MRLLPALAVVVALTLMPGCSSDDDKPTKQPSALPSEADLQSYFDAVAAYDMNGLEKAQQIAADGSPAQGYAAYLADYAASAAAAGQPVDAAGARAVDGGFEACGGTGPPDQCATWADLEGEDGKLTDFTVNGTQLEDSLVDLTGQASISSPGLYDVQPDWAYRSPQSGSLFVLVTVTAKDVPLSPKPGIYVEQDKTLQGVETRAPATIDANTSSPVVLAFPGAQDATLDGQVTFGVGVQDAGAESIGFGLSDPA